MWKSLCLIYYTIILRTDKIFMSKYLASIKSFLLDLIFPKFCISCGREGSHICYDCLSMVEILEYQFCPVCQKRVIDGKICKNCRTRTNLAGLFAATPYQNKIVKKMINKFKYTPYIKNLSFPLYSLIISHLKQLNNYSFSILDNGILIPVPLHRKRLKIRGFNQTEKIANHFSEFLKIPLIKDVLIKTKESQSQIGLSSEQRKQNIQGVFTCENIEQIKAKKILLIDDVFTTGSTMEECAKTLNQAGAKEVWGIVVARE